MKIISLINETNTLQFSHKINFYRLLVFAVTTTNTKTFLIVSEYMKQIGETPHQENTLCILYA